MVELKQPTVEYLDHIEAYRLEGKLRPGQWRALADMILFWCNINRTSSFVTIGNNLTGLSTIADPSIPLGNGEQVVGGDMVIYTRYDDEKDMLCKLLHLATTNPLVAVEFSGAKDIKYSQSQRLTWFRSNIMEGVCDIVCSTNRTDGKGKDGRLVEKWATYFVLPENEMPLSISRRIKEVTDTEHCNRTDGMFVRTVLLPRDFPALCDVQKGTNASWFYVVTEPIGTPIPRPEDVHLFATEDALRNGLVGLVEQPDKKILSSGRFPVFYEW